MAMLMYAESTSLMTKTASEQLTNKHSKQMPALRARKQCCPRQFHFDRLIKLYPSTLTFIQAQGRMRATKEVVALNIRGFMTRENMTRIIDASLPTISTFRNSSGPRMIARDPNGSKGLSVTRI
jgi:hypothetical protein